MLSRQITKRNRNTILCSKDRQGNTKHGSAVAYIPESEELDNDLLLPQTRRSSTAVYMYRSPSFTIRIIIPRIRIIIPRIFYHKGALYIGMLQVGQHRSHTFVKSAFAWQYTFNLASVFTKGYLWSKCGGPQKLTKSGLQESCLYNNTRYILRSKQCSSCKQQQKASYLRNQKE